MTSDELRRFHAADDRRMAAEDRDWDEKPSDNPAAVMDEHTPGPWTLKERHHVWVVCCTPTRPSEHEEVLFFERIGRPDGAGSVTAQMRTTEELARNARLCSLAPELLHLAHAVNDGYGDKARELAKALLERYNTDPSPAVYQEERAMLSAQVATE